ncbi:MAG: Fur family transcriptional regulator [Kiritimatiellia bacterium]
MENAREVTIEAFPAFCRERGLKCTAQRHAVFAAIRRSTSHPSVDGTWAAVRKKVPSITRDSVYRILNEFSSVGLISRMDALSAARYDTCLAPHAHFICEVCGSVTDYPLPESLAIPAGMPPDHRHVELRVSGVCNACRKKSRIS